jgi:hypothetical protein
LQMFSGFNKVMQRSNLSDSRGCGGFQLRRRWTPRRIVCRFLISLWWYLARVWRGTWVSIRSIHRHSTTWGGGIPWPKGAQCKLGDLRLWTAMDQTQKETS